jgi:isopenicillin N synthase-like dioxygenase
VSAAVPVIDLAGWYGGDAGQRDGLAARVDEALQRSGFLLVAGHRVDPGLRAGVRAAAREFFALPGLVKRRYAVTIGGRGWLPPGVEANALVEGTPSPPDLKESFAVGADRPIGDPEIDGYWFPSNVWPVEVPRLRALLTGYLAAMRALADDLLTVFAHALGQPADHFTRLTGHPTYTCNLNHYPSLAALGPPLPGQWRIGPHTDFGTVTLLDREPGAGGLQVHDPEAVPGRPGGQGGQGGQGGPDEPGWADAPYLPDAYTVNIGDLLAYWTGGRWRSGRHRVLPPSARAPEEDLVSLVFFYETDALARIDPLPPPIGRIAEPRPVVSTSYLRERLDAISVPPAPGAGA